MPYAGLIQDAAGNLYGTTNQGGGNRNGGTVFEVDSTGHETVLYSFCSASGCPDGAAPYAGLIQDAAGNLYGTTSAGGADVGGGYGGTVFKVDNTGHETVLYSFCSVGGANCTDGQQPGGGLIQDAAGNLYGTTSTGGANAGPLGQGGGTVFKVDSTGHETVLYSFCSAPNCTDGSYPMAGLIQDAAGNLYGTTTSGGATACNAPYGCGTVFKLDNTGHETVLYTFCSAPNCTDGAEPAYAGLIQDAAGNLYGTTRLGPYVSDPNSPCNPWGCGMVFKLAAGGGGGGSVSITLTSTVNPSYVDQSVTFSVVVSGSGATPTGSVTFKEGTTALGTVTLADGKASLTTTFTKSGTAAIVARALSPIV